MGTCDAREFASSVFFAAFTAPSYIHRLYPHANEAAFIACTCTLDVATAPSYIQRPAHRGTAMEETLNRCARTGLYANAVDDLNASSDGDAKS
ncbi:hypothetical protein BHM03_00020827 [Ensete ventricosum]|nr:hypothetical protein BHM03_00020827 [Ensete ventricosum]